MLFDNPMIPRLMNFQPAYRRLHHAQHIIFQSLLKCIMKSHIQYLRHRRDVQLTSVRLRSARFAPKQGRFDRYLTKKTPVTSAVGGYIRISWKRNASDCLLCNARGRIQDAGIRIWKHVFPLQLPKSRSGAI